MMGLYEACMANRRVIEFNSHSLHPSRRLREWQDLVGDYLADVDMKRQKQVSAADAYGGSMSLRDVQVATFAKIRSAHHLISRTPARVRRACRETVLFNIMLAGECRIEQGGQRARLGPGDMCLYESVRPYDLATPGQFEALVVMVDRQMMAKSLGNLSLFTGRTLNGSKSSTAMARQYWLSFASRSGDLSSSEISPLVMAGVNILRVALGSIVSVPLGQTPSATFALQRAKMFVRDNFHRHTLSPDEVARASGLSLRRLQELFQFEGTTIAGYIRNLRLELARERLDDPMLNGSSIASIMESVGFVNQSHFARAFQKAYGQSARDRRRATLQSSMDVA